jgi:hypothetical protein
MNRTKIRALALIGVAAGLLALEAIALGGAAMVVSGVRDRAVPPGTRVVTVTQGSRRERVVVRAAHRSVQATKASDGCVKSQVREAVWSAVEAAL